MARPLIGRTIRRLREERSLSQQALAARLGISASYLNLIEHDQRAVTASLLLKLGRVLDVDMAALSGAEEQALAVGLREVFSDPVLGERVEERECAAFAGAAPNAARATLALYRAWRIAREEVGDIVLPSGRRLLLPNEEARDFFHEHANHFPALEAAAEAIVAALAPALPAETNHALAERLRRVHGLTVRVGPLPGALRRYDAVSRELLLSESLPRESRGFHMAFQVALLEARALVEDILAAASPSSEEAAGLIRIGLLNYLAGAILMPYEPFRTTVFALRHDVEALADRFAVSFEQTCHRLSTLQRPGSRGVPFFFLRIDPAGNVSKRFSAAGFPFARFGGSCPRFLVHGAFASPGRVQVQLARLPDGARFLCFARTVRGATVPWGEPPPLRVVAMGCSVAEAGAVVYADGLDLERAAVEIGLSCRLCERPDCRSRAFPPLAHRLALDPNSAAAAPFRFEPRKAN